MNDSTLRDLPRGLWAFLAALIVALAIALHAVFPRYEFRIVGEDGRGIIVYDRWTGKFQRADYSTTGEPTLRPVLTPF
jgi:hypothetical protein